MTLIRQCPKCKTTDTSNKGLVMMINECGHPICQNCVNNIFAKNSAPCPICGKVLRKNYYWEQKFENPSIEREVFHRKRLSKIFCLKEDEFPDTRAYDDYLEKFENIIINLVEGIDVEQTEAEIARFKEQNMEIIERNRKKPSADDLWIKRMLDEEAERQKRVSFELSNENNQTKKKNAEDMTKEVLNELKSAGLPAEVIVDRRRKQQIEQEILLRDEEKKKKVLKLANRQEKVTFGSISASGHPYMHVLPKMHISGPQLPSPSEMETFGYLAHVPATRPDKLAGGFTPALGLTRYFQMDNIEHVYQAIELLNGQSPEQSSAAAKWLSDFQKSVYAWQISDTLLQHNRHYQACYFGAQTIRQKILNDFRELPADSYESLRDSLIQHLKRMEQLNPDHYGVIVTQLALALADLYLQVPQWIGFISEVVNMFASGNDGALNIMLALLRVFPEELAGRHLKLGSNRRDAVQQELAGNFETLVDCLTQILHSHQENPAMIKKVIQCISPWINNPQNKTDTFAASSLLQNMLQLLSMTNVPSDIYEANCEALSSAVILCEEVNSHYKLATTLQLGIYGSAPTFTALVAAEDFDKCASLARLYVEMAESFIVEIANQPGKNLGDLRTLDLLLLIVDHHDYSMAEMTFSVWYRLSEFVFQITDDDSFSHLLSNFKPYVERYILSLYRHCQLDIDYEGVQDNKDDFITFRERAAESIKDVSFILSSIQLLNSVIQLIESNTTGNWNEVESALFIASTVIGNIAETDECVIPPILRIILNFPTTAHSALLNTGAEVLGSIADWFVAHDQHMTLTFNWLLSLSSKLELLKSAAEAIESICKANYEKLRHYFNDLVVFMHRVELCQTNGVRAEAAAQAILRSCALLLNDLPAQDIALQLEDLCRDPIERLTKIAAAHRNGHGIGNENTRDSWARASMDPLIWIDRLTSIFKTLTPWHLQKAFKTEHARHNGTPQSFETVPKLQVPWLQLGGNVWGAVQLILEAFQSNFRTVEHCCRCLRYLIRSMGAQSVTFVGDLANLIVRIYDANPHSCFLYLGSVIVDEYGAFPNVLPQLMEMGRVIANRSFVLFQQPNGLQNNPDTIDDLFRLAFRFVQRVPAAFFSDRISRDLFECAIIALELDHSEAHRSVTKFFDETLKSVQMAKKAGGNHPALDAVDNLLDQLGESLIWHCIHAALFSVSSNLWKDITEIMFDVFEIYKQKFAVWLKSALQRLAQERGSLGASQEQLEKFHGDAIRIMSRAPDNSTSVKQVTSKLRECEDFNLALRLQEEEFNSHYDRNRSERRVMGLDTKKSKEEHERERREALEKRMREHNEVARRDEELARRMQMEIEAEERRRVDEQARVDADVARRLHEDRHYSDEEVMSPIPYEEDERLARELQERYLRRVSGTRGMLDERTQNELVYYVGRQVISPPENLLPRRNNISELGPPEAIHATHFSPIAAVPPMTTMIDPAILPPLPSYTEVCSPTTPVVTTVNSGFGSCGTTTATVSPSTTRILTETGNAAIPARAVLHPVVRQEARNTVIGRIEDSSLPDPPLELRIGNNNNNSCVTNNENQIDLSNLHPTNPFLQDLLISQYNANNPGSSIPASSSNSNNLGSSIPTNSSNSSNQFESGFGLPPPSALFHATGNLARERESGSLGRVPQGAIPLPPPIDYTTIPGLKTPEFEETEEGITFDPGTLIIERSQSKGCLEDFENTKITEILEMMAKDYGSLSSAFFGPRYIVLLSGKDTVSQMEKYKDESSGICPFAFGSVILGDPFFWERRTEKEWTEIISGNDDLKDFVSHQNQENLVLKFPESGRTVWDWKKIQKSEDENAFIDSKISVYSFDVEIDIDGHRIPAFIPILVYIPSENDQS